MTVDTPLGIQVIELRETTNLLETSSLKANVTFLDPNRDAS